MGSYDKCLFLGPSTWDRGIKPRCWTRGALGWWSCRCSCRGAREHKSALHWTESMRQTHHMKNPEVKWPFVSVPIIIPNLGSDFCEIPLISMSPISAPLREITEIGTKWIVDMWLRRIMANPRLAGARLTQWHLEQLPEKDVIAQRWLIGKLSCKIWNSFPLYFNQFSFSNYLYNVLEGFSCTNMELLIPKFQTLVI